LFLSPQWLIDLPRTTKRKINCREYLFIYYYFYLQSSFLLSFVPKLYFYKKGIKDIPALNVWPVETNIIIAEIKDGDSTSSNRLRDILKQKGVLISRYSLPLYTHLSPSLFTPSSPLPSLPFPSSPLLPLPFFPLFIFFNNKN
jgi:hypothetical protein